MQNPYDFSDTGDNYQDAGFEPLPNGDYTAVLVKAEDTTAKDKPNVKMFKFEFEILSGQYAKRKIWTNTTYVHPTSQQAMAIGRKFMRQIAEATCGGAQFNPMAAIGKPITVRLTTEEYNGKRTNRVSKVGGPHGFPIPQGQAPVTNTQAAPNANGDITF